MTGASVRAMLSDAEAMHQLIALSARTLGAHYYSAGFLKYRKPPAFYQSVYNFLNILD